MSTIEIQAQQIASFQGTTVRIRGYVQTVRDLGNLVFLVIRDAEGYVQAVAHNSDVLPLAKTLTPESVVSIEGTVVQQTKKQEQYEISITRLEILAQPVETPPVEISKTNKVDALALTTMLDYRPLTLRSEKARAIFRIEAEFCAAFGEFLRSQRFVEIHSPKIVSTGTEGGADLFAIDYFGSKAFLTRALSSINR